MKLIYRFGGEQTEGDASMANVLGGKGAHLAEMCKLGLPVPPGFTIATAASNQFRQYGADQVAKAEFLDHLMAEVLAHMAWLEQQFGYMPLVSVRSGAPVSMPGMMDTVLNVGLTDELVLAQWKDRIGKRPALDSYRRLIQMLGTVYGVPASWFEMVLKDFRKAKQVKTDAELDAPTLADVIKRFKWGFEEHTGLPFPDTLHAQLQAAIVAVFDSWMSPRAIAYRKLHGIPDDLGTAVNVQAMVFGNMGEGSGTGVLFTRNPNTGIGADNGVVVPYGEFLINAQGEDVVAGTHQPRPLFDMINGACNPPWPGIYDQLCAVSKRLEEHYRDMMDIEFTVQQGELWVLQCRIGKRSALAAFRIAADMVEEELIDRATALGRVSAQQYKAVRRPRVADEFEVEPHAVGIPAAPGVASGAPVFSSHETTPDDIAGMAKAKGILTAIGGTTSHAAVVARAMDKPCVVGCVDLQLPPDADWDDVHWITICGDTGRVWCSIEVPVVDAASDPAVLALSKWAFEASGYAAKMPVPPRNPTQFALHIAAADWWGNDEALSAVLDRLAGLGDLSQVVLDLTPPSVFLPEEDRLLNDCVGETYETPFRLLIAKQLQARADQLTGLTLLFHNPAAEDFAAWAKLGYRMVARPKTVADVFQADMVLPEPAFIEQVIGGEAAWAGLLQALAKAGEPVQVLPPAVPAPYAVFTVLNE